MHKAIVEFVRVSVAVLVGVIGPRVVMGCLASKSADAQKRDNMTAAQKTSTGVVPIGVADADGKIMTKMGDREYTKSSMATGSAVDNSEGKKKEPTLASLPADPEADPSGQVLSVPRATVSVGDRERAELKVKNLRDRLENDITRCEEVLQDEGRLALQMRREGREVSARVLVRRRLMLKRKMERAETMLTSIGDMLHGLEVAQDNRRLVDALERGTEAINELSRDVSVDRVQEALHGHREAIAYVDEVNSLIKSDASAASPTRVGDGLADDDYENTMRHLAEEFGSDAIALPPGDQEDSEAVDRIPDAPTEMPAAVPSSRIDNETHTQPSGAMIAS